MVIFEPIAALVARGRLEAVAAVDRAVAPRLERHLRLIPATAAGHGVHLALGTSATVAAAAAAATGTLCLTGGPAIGATRRLIREALLGEEFLLTGAEREWTRAIDAGQSLILVHVDRILSLTSNWCRRGSSTSARIATTKPRDSNPLALTKVAENPAAGKLFRQRVFIIRDE